MPRKERIRAGLARPNPLASGCCSSCLRTSLQTAISTVHRNDVNGAEQQHQHPPLDDIHDDKRQRQRRRRRRLRTTEVVNFLLTSLSPRFVRQHARRLKASRENMQPSQKTIEREYEALRDIRRRSSAQGGPGSLILDPDLPAEQPATAPPPLSPQAWAAATNAKDHSLSPTKSSPSSSTVHGADQETDGNVGNSAVEDPFNLFWVPAHLHPELAPSEFRAFLKEHAHHAPAEGTIGEANLLGRSSSASAASLGRKRSMLSRQYSPRDNDGIEEEEKVIPLRRNKSIFDRQGPQLTISDLQKLEELADAASKSEDPTQLRKVLRRSITLNVAPSFLDQMDAVPDTEDDADAPIIVPPRNQILKRTARTRIRKPNLSGDGGGHRFPASRRKSARADSVDQVTSPTDGSSSGHGEIEPSTIPPLPPATTSATTTSPVHARKRTLEREEPQDNRRFTYTDEASIFDAYAETPEDEKPASPPPSSVTQPTARLVVETPAPEPVPFPVLAPARPSISEPALSSAVISVALESQPQPSQSTAPPVLYQPQPQRLLSPEQQQQELRPSSRSPSPETASSAQEIQRPDSRSSVKSEGLSHHTMSSTASDKRKEKDKKSLWRKVGGGNSDKGSKKGAKDKDKDKDKDGGFFGSLFGGGKKKQEEAPSTGLGGGAGPATAAALLGASKSNNRAYSPSISPQLGNPYARYPIHVERAIYRLSHIKLANPRRPLYEQVLISNLMFWYLGVINKSNQGPGSQNQNNQTQNQNQQSQTQTQTGGGAAQGVAAGTSIHDLEKEHSEKDREQREREERERMEKERMETQQQQQRRESRRGSLTKPSQANTGRRAEMAVKGPQYHLQSQVIEQEYSNVSVGVGGIVTGSSPAPVTRTSSAPPPMSQAQGYGMNGGYSSRVQSMPPTKSQQQQQTYSQPNGNPAYYYGRSTSVDYTNSGLGSGSLTTNSSSNLPPGAMPPLPPADPAWLATQVIGGSLPRTQTSSHGYSQSADYDYSLSYNQQPTRPSRSPPGNINNVNPYEWNSGRNGDAPASAKIPSRSLSASAVAPASSHSQSQDMQYSVADQYRMRGGTSYGQAEPPSNGKLKKKMASASAVAPDRDRRQRTSDDEDVPLAMWQAQRRR